MNPEQFGTNLRTSEKREDNYGEREILFSTLARGDMLDIETGSGTSYQVTITGVMPDGVRVSVREVSPAGSVREFTAQMPGGFEMDIRNDQNSTLKEGRGIIQGIIKKSTSEELNCLYFENVRNSSGKRERIARSIRTTPITGIVKRS